MQRKNPDRLGDVLELGLAEIAYREVEPRLHLAIGVFGKADRARSSDTFQPRGWVLEHMTDAVCARKLYEMVMQEAGGAGRAGKAGG